MSLVSYTAYSGPHPFLISAWSIAGCCDAVRGEPCQSTGTVTFQRTGITLLTLLLWLEFSPSSPRDDLTLFTLRRDAGGCSELVPLLHPPPSLFLTSAVHSWNILCKHISLLMLFFFYFLQAQLHLAFKWLLHPSLHVDWTFLYLPLLPHCHLKIMYHKICNLLLGVGLCKSARVCVWGYKILERTRV